MKVYIGYQSDAWDVASASLMKHSGISALPVKLGDMIERGLYWRVTEIRNGQYWDKISQASMSTEFAITRFLTLHLAKEGWALFTDGDVLFRADVRKLLALADKRYAVMCVKHAHDVPEHYKKDGREQLRYARKNWSSVMLMNCDHPANKRLTINLINTIPGRDLHRFCWLEDHEIGSLPVEWNWLVGFSPSDVSAKIAHFTNGLPTALGCEHDAYADEWRSYHASQKGEYERRVSAG